MEEDEEEVRATPVWYAVARGENLPLVRFLLKHGADASYSLSAVPFRRDDAVLMRELLKCRPRLDLGAHGETPIFYAARLQRLEDAGLADRGGCRSPRSGTGAGGDTIDVARARRLPKDVIARLAELKERKRATGKL